MTIASLKNACAAATKSVKMRTNRDHHAFSSDRSLDRPCLVPAEFRAQAMTRHQSAAHLSLDKFLED